MSIFRTNKALGVCLAMAASLVFPALSLAASIQVPSMGIQTISEAMMRTRVGDTVLVDNGIYREHVLIAP
jgi:hypothetical protein